MRICSTGEEDHQYPGGISAVPVRKIIGVLEAHLLYHEGDHQYA